LKEEAIQPGLICIKSKSIDAVDVLRDVARKYCNEKCSGDPTDAGTIFK
jgi:hypothetical protein